MKNFNGTIIKNGLIIFAASYAAIKGFKEGCKEFERLVPEVVDKIAVGRAVAETLVSNEEEEEE